ncbi:TetR family transcriptional regulator [Paenibacillus sp. BIHB 4019]|uniref:TetR family transcriptional regulator n=1 Tax=Paenibacillus sp. BIHB 4019 TaxID=1870819 RepID=A0A1B2DR13_9BACL|nr:TetR/AcrR family transcriptional regulator [Paenibacillus sp. BIHB 4019]ANY70138.1 TetR family transcriptional regulator [Paenibacillus sp. BIHB 4019]
MHDENKVNDKLNETRLRLIVKLMPYVLKNGFQALRMDDIAKIMDVSRATLYKYFSAKEEIIGGLVEGFVTYINELVGDEMESERSYGIRFQLLFEQSVLLAVNITDVFLKELADSYPDGYERLKNAMQKREQQLLDFYAEGIHKGIFNKISGKLLILQDELLQSMIDIKYLVENQLSVHQVLSDYYILKKLQLFKPEKLEVVDDELMSPRFDYLVQKINKSLY